MAYFPGDEPLGGLTSQFPPHLCSESGPHGRWTTYLPNACEIGSFAEEKLKKIPVLDPIFRFFWVSGKFFHVIYQCPVFLFRNVATAEHLKDYEWLPNTYLFLGQRLFQDRAVIRQKMAWKSCQVFDRLTEIDCAHRSQFQQWGTWGNDPQIELIFLGVWALSSTLREQRLTKIWSSDREVKQLKASCQRSSSPKQQRSEAGINRFWVPHLKSLNSGPFILFVPYFLLSFIPTLVLCWHSIRDSGFLSCLSKSPSSFAKVRHIALARQSAQGQESKGG